MQQDIIDLNKKIDAEILLSLCIDAELVKVEEWINKPFDNIEDLISNLARIVIRGKYKDTDTVVRMHKNRGGFSVSIKNEKIEEVMSFINRDFTIDNRDEEFDRERFYGFINRLKRPQLEYFYQNDTYQPKNNRLVFYFRFNQYSYTNFLIYYAIFEMIHLVETFEIASEELLDREEDYNEHQRRMSHIYEREMYERNMREQRIREQQRAEEERRQQLLNMGATEEGIEIANRLMEILGRR